jgi:hypothetical protein
VVVAIRRRKVSWVLDADIRGDPTIPNHSAEKHRACS